MKRRGFVSIPEQPDLPFPRVEHMLINSKGQIKGFYRAKIQPRPEELQIIYDFLCKVNEDKKNERTNMPDEKIENHTLIAGYLKANPQAFENQTRALIDVGMKSAISVSIFTGANVDDKQLALAKELEAYQSGDFIKVRCLLRPYGVKQDNGTWKNSLSIDVLEILTMRAGRSKAATATKKTTKKTNGESKNDQELPY